MWWEFRFSLWMEIIVKSVDKYADILLSFDSYKHSDLTLPLIDPLLLKLIWKAY